MDERFKPPVGVPEGKEKLKRRLLIAEDERLIRSDYVEFLTEQGYIVDAVENGELLLEKLRTSKENYDIVITDNDMPVLTGIEIMRAIHEDPRFNNLPVIMISAYITNEMEDEIKGFGYTLLNKPISLSNIAKTVESILNKDK